MAQRMLGELRKINRAQDAIDGNAGDFHYQPQSPDPQVAYQSDPEQIRPDSRYRPLAAWKSSQARENSPLAPLAIREGTPIVYSLIAPFPLIDAWVFLYQLAVLRRDQQALLPARAMARALLLVISIVSTPIVFVHRLFGALALDAATYEEIEADRKGTPQAVLVVLMSAAAAGIGARGFGDDPRIPLVGVAAIALVTWATWAAITLQIGGRVFPEPWTKVDFGELMRTIGFASAPGILRVFGLITPLAAPMFVLTAIWMLVAMIVAVRQALDYTSTVRAVMVCTFGFTLALVVAAVLGMLLTTPVA